MSKINVESVLNSKTYVREGSIARSPKEYLEPVIEMFEKNNAEVSIKVEKLQQNANEDESVNTAYARVLVEGYFPEYDLKNLGSGSKIGYVYALDKKVPEFVTYGGQEIFACTNLTVTSDGDVVKFKDSHKQAISSVEDFIYNLEQRNDKIIRFHNRLQNKSLSNTQLDLAIGKILRWTNTKYKNVGQTAVLFGHKKLINSETVNLWELYNGITEHYSNKFKTNKYLQERPLKTVELSKIFDHLNVD